MEPTPLPPLDGRFDDDESTRDAYQRIIPLETQNPVWIRILGYMLIYAPNENGRQEVARNIKSCATDRDVIELGQSFFKYFVQYFKLVDNISKFETFSPPLPLSNDLVQDQICNTTTPATYSEAKSHALIRDNYRCMLTQAVDLITYSKSPSLRAHLGASPPPLLDETECCHILPRYFVNDENKEKQTAHVAIFKMLECFGGINHLELNERGLHHLTNIMTLQASIRKHFIRLQLWLDPVNNVNNTYAIGKRLPGYQSDLPSIVTFTTSNPALSLPDHRYLALHAACAKVVNFSGAINVIDSIIDEMEEAKVLSHDGSSAELLEYLLTSNMEDETMKDATKRSETKPKNIQLTNLPHELISEIAKQIAPLDLIHLARVNKLFRGLFLDRSMAYIWRATLANVGLPLCPDDSMPEPSYAALMFLKKCTECAEPASRHVDPIFLVRLCSSCRKHLAVKAGTGALILPLILLRSQFLVPFKGNERPYWYMKDEYEEIDGEFNKLREAQNPQALEVFIDERKKVVRDWNEKTKPLVEWVENREKEYKLKLNRLQLARRTEIKARLLKLGWEQAEVQECFYLSPDAKPLVYKAKSLDDVDWTAMLPHLLVGLEASRKNRFRIEANRRRSNHEEIVVEWLNSLPDQLGHMDLTLHRKESIDSPTSGPINMLCARRCQQRSEKEDITIRIPSLPANNYMLNWPPIEELLNQDKPTKVFQLEFENKRDHLKEQFDGWRAKLEAVLVKALPETFKPVETQSSQYSLELHVDPPKSAALDDKISADLRTLLRADVIFRYDHKLVYYPDAFTSWAINTRMPTYDPASSTAAKAILNALQHPDASYLEMRALGPSFVCGRCPSDLSYLPWEEIVTHFIYEYERWKLGSRWNERYREEGGGITLVFTHDINDSSKPLVHLVAEADRTTHSKAPETECKVCLGIGQHYRTGVQHITKHIQATHLIESPVGGEHYT